MLLSMLLGSLLLGDVLQSDCPMARWLGLSRGMPASCA